MDWKKNRIWIGAIVLVALVGLVIWQMKGQGETVVEEGDDEDTEGLLPEIDRESIDELIITRPEEDPVRLTKDGDEWRVAEPVDAIADEGVVDTALDKLTELEFVRVAATNAANHERLEVADDAGIHVVANGGGETLIDFYIGAYSSGNTMIRLEGEERVFAVAGSIKFAFNKELKDWRNRRVVNIAPSDVTRIDFQNENGTWSFSRGDDDEWAEPEGQEPIERFGPAKIQSIVASLARMRAVNFAAEGVTRESAGVDGETAAVVTLTVGGGGGGPSQDADGGTAEEAPAGPTEQIVLRLGGPTEDNEREFHLVRDGDENIYVVASFLGDKIRVNTEAFQTPEPEETPDGGAAAAPPGMPPGMPPGGPGGQDIPPEVMEQIQRQLQQQGLGMAP